MSRSKWFIEFSQPASRTRQQHWPRPRSCPSNRCAPRGSHRHGQFACLSVLSMEAFSTDLLSVVDLLSMCLRWSLLLVAMLRTRCHVLSVCECNIVEPLHCWWKLGSFPVWGCRHSCPVNIIVGASWCTHEQGCQLGMNPRVCRVHQSSFRRCRQSPK